MCETYLLGAVATTVEPQGVMQALDITAVIVVGLTMFTFAHRHIDYDKAAETGMLGMDVIVCTNAKTDDEARELLRGFNFPFRT